MKSLNQETTEGFNISICNQKGGVGKSSLTVLIASYLHYTAGYDVLVETAISRNGPFRLSENGS